MSPQRAERNDSGFTLVEALVALAVFAVACVALIAMQTQSVRTLSAIEARTLGAVLAQNMLVDAAAADTPPSLGQSAGETSLAGRSWTWRMEVTGTIDPGTRRVRVVVADGAAVAAEATAFVRAPATP